MPKETHQEKKGKIMSVEIEKKTIGDAITLYVNHVEINSNKRISVNLGNIWSTSRVNNLVL